MTLVKIMHIGLIVFLPLITQANEEELKHRVDVLEQELQQLKERVNALIQLTKSQSTDKTSATAHTISKLSLVRWYYRTQPIKFDTYYAIDIELKNEFDKNIKELDARIHFRNPIAGHFYSITVTPTLAIPAGQITVDKGTENNNRLLSKNHQLLILKKEDIEAELIIRKIVFDDNTLLNF